MEVRQEDYLICLVENSRLLVTVSLVMSIATDSETENSWKRGSTPMINTWIYYSTRSKATYPRKAQKRVYYPAILLVIVNNGLFLRNKALSARIEKPPVAI